MRPWVHYIPVHANLSNLRAMTALVTKPAYDEILLNITKNAALLAQQFTVSQEVTRVAHDLVRYLAGAKERYKSASMRKVKDFESLVL